MTDLRTATQQALEALEYAEANHGGDDCYADSITALRAALAEPVQEPVAWIHTDPDKRRVKFLEWRENEPGYRGDWMKTPLYTAPFQRKPLTEEKIYSLFRTAGSPVLFARAIERAHGIGSSDVGT